MNKAVLRILTGVGLLVCAYLCIAILGAVAQLADFADRAHAGAGFWVFWSVLAILCILVALPVLLFFRLPKPLVPPSAEASAETRAAYRRDLRQRLAGNPLLPDGVPENDDEAVAGALAILGERADALVRQTASSVFVSTAVMQNGRLDGLLVLCAQLRLVWRLAVVYQQRPSPRQILFLYSNVAANVLIADSIQEIDFAEIAAPVVAGVFPSLNGGIPGLQGVSNLLVNSLANGAANAFLSLRVGLIAKAYSAALIAPDRRAVRHAASTEALKAVGTIVKEQGGRIAAASWHVLRDSLGEAADATAHGVKSAIRKTAEATRETVRGTVRSVGAGVHGGVQSVKGMLSSDD